MSSVLEFDTANRLGLFENREEWLEVRKSGIGGSEVAAICGLSKWESAYTLWLRKTGRAQDKDLSANEAVEWGNRLEPVVIDKFEESHPELTVFRDVGTYAHKERDWQRCNPDGIYQLPSGEYGVLEIKTAQFEDDWIGGIPKYYYTQVQWYLQTLGLGEAVVAVLFHGNKYREYLVQANSLEQDINIERVTYFMKCVRDDIAPELDDLEATYEAVRAQHPNIDPEKSEELGDLGVLYLQQDAVCKREYATLQGLKTRVLDAMGDAKTGLVYDEPVFTRSARGAESLPYLQLKKGKVQ
jgi:putative phage-type endonuclease